MEDLIQYIHNIISESNNQINDKILGVHIIGRNASEVIHIGQMAMMFHSRIDFFTDQVFNYPTYAEGYRIAALNGMNKIKGRR